MSFRTKSARPGPAHRGSRTRITTDRERMGGVPFLRRLRIPVATILNLVAEGQTAQDIVSLYPDLEPEDVREALLFDAGAGSRPL